MVRAECCGDCEISRNRHFANWFPLQLGGVVVGALWARERATVSFQGQGKEQFILFLTDQTLSFSFSNLGFFLLLFILFICFLKLGSASLVSCHLRLLL